MFENLNNRLRDTIGKLTGLGRLTESNVQDTLREIRIALLEADVALPVAKEFVAEIEQEALGEKVLKSVTPGQMLVKIVNDALVKTLGEATAELDFKTQPPAIILMAGLQGSGKTTTTAKLAKLIQERYKKKVLVTSADVYRPAAIKQLETVALQVGAEFYPSDASQKPIHIAKSAVDHAKKHAFDVVIIDTAGRLHVDNDMMSEIKDLHKAVNPIETLFVVDSMTGQDAINTAKAFNDALPLTGIVLTKTDGDARGGVALSVWKTIHRPIKFIGTGEKMDGFEVFHPDRIASRILGMGDIVSLVEDVEQKIDKQKADKWARKFKKGQGFDFEDFLDQLDQMNNLGGIAGIMGKIPGLSQIPQAMKEQVNDKKFTQMKAIIQSMTIKERRRPMLMQNSSSRKRRIANGAGVELVEVGRLIKQFEKMQKMMKKISKGGIMNMMKQFKGQLPPGMGLPGL